jgi:hypothetical protein
MNEDVAAERERCARICEALTIGDEEADRNLRAAIAAIRDGAPAE